MKLNLCVILLFSAMCFRVCLAAEMFSTNPVVPFHKLVGSFSEVGQAFYSVENRFGSPDRLYLIGEKQTRAIRIQTRDSEIIYNEALKATKADGSSKVQGFEGKLNLTLGDGNSYSAVVLLTTLLDVSQVTLKQADLHPDFEITRVKEEGSNNRNHFLISRYCEIKNEKQEINLNLTNLADIAKCHRTIGDSFIRKATYGVGLVTLVKVSFKSEKSYLNFVSNLNTAADANNLDGQPSCKTPATGLNALIAVVKKAMALSSGDFSLTSGDNWKDSSMTIKHIPFGNFAGLSNFTNQAQESTPFAFNKILDFDILEKLNLAHSALSERLQSLDVSEIKDTALTKIEREGYPEDSLLSLMVDRAKSYEKSSMINAKKMQKDKF